MVSWLAMVEVGVGDVLGEVAPRLLAAGDAAFDSGARAGLLVAAIALLLASLFVALALRSEASGEAHSHAA